MKINKILKTIMVVVIILVIILSLSLLILKSISTTKSSEEIPKGSIPVQVITSKNPNEIVYVNPEELTPHPRRGHNFSKEFIEKTKYVQETLHEVDASSLEVWLEDFDRDAHPERELEIWLNISNTYKEVIEDYPNNLEIRKEIYRTILLSSMGTEDYVLSQLEGGLLSNKEIKGIIEKYRND